MERYQISRSCITKINSTFTDNAEDLDIVMSMYNLLGYSQNYSMTSESLWNYYRDEIDDDNNNASNGKSFKCKARIIGKTEARPARSGQPCPDQDGNQPPRPGQPPIPCLNKEVTLPIKYLSNFWRSLDLALINCEVELDLKWSRNCVLIEEDDHIKGVGFTITSTRLYVPVIIFSINNNIKFLENIMQGFKRTIYWNKYRSEITTQPKNNNLDYLIDPTFRNVNRLPVFFLFKNGDSDPTRNSFDKTYMPLVQIKDFNALIDNKPFFDQPVKNKQKAYEKLIEMSRNDEYTTGNLLDYLYHHWYRLI